MRQFAKGDTSGMDRNQIRYELLSILKKFMPKAPEASVITDGTTLSQELNIDSADLIEIVLAIEEQFSITVADEHLNRIKTFGDLLSLVTELTAA
jgi:acyl carrier protein